MFLCGECKKGKIHLSGNIWKDELLHDNGCGFGWPGQEQ